MYRLEDYRQTVARFLGVLQRINPQLGDFNTALRGIIEESRKQIEIAVGGGDFTSTWSQILSDLEGVRGQILNQIQGSIPEEEFTVLFLIVRMMLKGGWIALTTALPVLAKECKKPENEVRESVRKLLEKGLLVNGISLPI